MENDLAKPSHLEGADAEQLRQFLASAPAELKAWADQQLADLEDSPDKATVPDKPAGQEVGLEAFAEFSDDEPVFDRKPAARKAAGGVNKVNLILVALLAAAVVIIIQQTGRSAPSGMTETNGAQASAMPMENTGFPALDETRAAELKKQAEAEPDNVGVLRDLGKLYFDSGLYQDAIVHFERALQIQPDDIEVLLSLGVAEYSVNNYTAAEQHWLRATQINPKLAEPWYNLGFLYLAQTPPNYEGVEKAWGKVVEIDPASELAQTAAAHLERMRDSAGTPSPGR